MCGLKLKWNLCWGLMALLYTSFLSLPAMAINFQSPMDESSWAVDGSIFECRMTQDIPYFGQAVFERLAGEPSSFYLNSKTARMRTGKASLVATAPVWKPYGQRDNLGWVDVAQGKKPVFVGSRQSMRMLAELSQGQEITITRKPWYGDEESLQVSLSTVSFQAAYRQYLTCLATLLPVNFEQIARTAIYFPSGREELKPSEILKLQHIITYVTADPSVTSFFVDGHTDGVGGRGENLDLSKLRAERVAKFLTDQGIPADQVATRWHGERYPVTTNRTRKGRAQNRRVTIRLEKEGGPSIPPRNDKLPALAANP